MKVLIVTDTNEYAIGHSFARALEQDNHEAVMFDLFKAIDKHIRLGKVGKTIHTFWPVETWIRKGNRELAIFAQKIRPDHIIVSGNAPILYGTIGFWKSIFPEIKITLFWPDMLTNLQTLQINSALLYDQIASYSKATLPIFQSLGFKKTIWMPFAGDTKLLGTPTRTFNENFKYDISFIGGWRPERERALMEIIKSFPNLKISIRGHYWARDAKSKDINKIISSEPLYGLAYGDFIRSSRINLNVIDDTNYPAANMRFFELPAAGGLQLCSYCPEQADIFLEGEHIFYFKNETELCTQIENIIKNQDYAERVRHNGYNHIISGHTYASRLHSILN